MSWETEEWARKQRVGDPVRKAVLVAIANEADSSGCNAFPSIRYIAFTVEVSERTVQRRLQELEDMLLLRRVRRHRPDGSQSSNGYDLIGYEPPLQWQDRPRRAPRREGDRLSPPSDNLAPAGDAGDAPPGDTAVTPRTPDEVPNPPTADERSSAVVPPGDRNQGDLELGDKPKAKRAERIPETWTPPPIEDLPEAAQAVLRQWPKGAYEFVATGFAAHWTAESGARASKRDWRAAWIKWLTSEGPRVMSMAKSGIRFANGANAAHQIPDSIVEKLTALRSKEGFTESKIRQLIKADVGDKTYDGWLAQTAIQLDGETAEQSLVIVRCPSEFTRDWVRQHFAATMRALTCRALGGDNLAVLVKTVDEP